MNLLKKTPYLLAIDGPAGSGKGTIAKIISKKLNLNYLDSGAVYRVLALAIINENIDQENIQVVLKKLEDIIISFQGEDIFLNNENVSKQIRFQEVGKAASNLAKHIDVRDQILEYQRNFFHGRGLVAEGRDMTTVVFPNADLKIYLEASLEERVKRRHKQLILKGKDVNILDLKDEIYARDKQDKEREHSPLIVSPDAFIVCSDSLTINETVKKILSLI